MRYLQFADICIDTHNQMLFKNGEAINLAPKVFELLLFFCHNSERVISKDELMEQVWAGTLVTDNAISRTLVKVRKALGDDPKSPEFIITVPRKGYRMIGRFEPTEEAKVVEPNTETHSVKPPVQTAQNYFNNPYLFTVLIGLIIASIIAVFFIFFNTSDPLQSKQITSLTRATGSETQPAMSPDLNWFAYTQINNKTGLKQVSVNNEKDNTHFIISHARGNISKLAWSPDSLKVAFLYKHNVVCNIFWAPINLVENKDNWEKITECDSDSFPEFRFSPDGESLFFNNRQSQISGYQIFRVNLGNKNKDIVNQPITNGRGNYHFDISPDGNKLVILNSEYDPYTRIYTLDLNDSKLTLTAKLKYLMRSVIWHHDSETLIHPSPHPAYELWQSNTSGEKIAVVASSPLRVKDLSRISNGKDFLFSSYLLNRDLHFKDLENNTSISMHNSSVMDYLPTIAHNSDQYAFASKRTNTAEVYIASLDTLTAKKITHFQSPVRLYALSFSPDDTKLLMMADNQIYITDITTEKTIQLPINNNAIRGVSWETNDRLLLSVIKNNNWQLMRFDLTKNELTQLHFSYTAGTYSIFDKHYYFINDETNQVMKLTNAQAEPEGLDLVCSPTFINRKLNLTVTKQGLICQTDIKPSRLSMFDFETGKSQDWQSLGTLSDFEVKDNSVIYAKIKQNVADIMRTNTQ